MKAPSQSAPRPRGSIRILVLALAVGSALLLLPAAAQATLAFTRAPLKPTVYIARDDGSGVKKLGRGFSPKVSPDGQMVLFFRNSKPGSLDVMVAAPGGPARKLIGGSYNTAVFAWSPDSKTVALTVGPEIGRQRLVAVDVESGARRTVTRGYFSSASFSPQGDELVYGQSLSENYPPRSDLFRAPLAAGAPIRLTSDHRSQYPLWGPTGQIVFVKLLGQKQRRYGPKNELFLIDAEGRQLKRLTHSKVPQLLQGLVPTDWSADGSRLLAEFTGQDTSYAVAVNPKTGAQRALTKEREFGFVGSAISADGSSVLGSLGGFEPGPGHKVVSVPYAGGKPKLLAKNALEPDWSR